MRRALGVGIASLGVFVVSEALADVELSKLEDARLARILALSVVSEVDRPESASHFLRLFAVGVEGDCVPETHWVCSFDYYLAISTFDSWPETAVYSLGRLGEISRVEFREANAGYQDTIRIFTTNYPAAVLKRVPSLKRTEGSYDFDILESVMSPAAQQGAEPDAE